MILKIYKCDVCQKEYEAKKRNYKYTCSTECAGSNAIGNGVLGARLAGCDNDKIKEILLAYIDEVR